MIISTGMRTDIKPFMEMQCKNWKWNNNFRNIQIEQMVYFDENTNLVRINKDYAVCPKEISNKTILFDENLSDILKSI